MLQPRIMTWLLILSLLHVSKIATALITDFNRNASSNCTFSSNKVECVGYNIAATVELLPSTTLVLHYVAREKEVALSNANFTHLKDLQELHIHTEMDEYRLIRQIQDIPPDQQYFLEPLKNLRVLKISVVWTLNYALNELLLPLVNLETLDLSQTKKINITNLGPTLEGFKLNTKLMTLNLWNIQMYEFAQNDMIMNLSVILQPISHCPLTSLNIGYNALKGIYPGLNRYAPKLLYFNVSHNLLMPLLLSAIVADVGFHRNLIEVDFNEQGVGMENAIKDRSGSEADEVIEKQSKQVLRLKRAVSSFSMTGHTDEQPQESKPSGINSQINNLLASHIGLAQLAQCKNLDDFCQILTPSCKPIFVVLETFHSLFCELLYMRSDAAAYTGFLRGIPCKVIPPIQQLFHRDCAGCLVIPITGTVQKIHLHGLNLFDEVILRPGYFTERKCFNEANNVTLLDFSDSFKNGYRDVNNFFSMEVKGLNYIRMFNFTNTGIESFQYNLQESFPEIEMLDISRNMISSNGMHLSFGNTTSLKFLDISSNSISDLDVDVFHKLIMLEKIYLRNNLLSEFTCNISTLLHLSYLDLSHNQLTQLSQVTINQLDQIALRSPNKTLFANMDSNQILCTCETLGFLKWILRDKPDNVVFENFNSLMCINSASDRMFLNKISLQGMKWECLSTPVLIAIGFSLALPVFSLILGFAVFVYKKRWWFRYQSFLAHRMWKSRQHRSVPHESFEYDLFVSYSERNCDWIDEVLQPKLEEELGFKLCLHHRDFELGHDIRDEISNAIERSRNVLFILSPAFMKSNWCMFEMSMAEEGPLFRNGEDVILLALLEPLPSVSGIIKRLMETKVYVEWTEDDYGQRLFWAKLAQAVRAPRRNPWERETHRETSADRNMPNQPLITNEVIA